MNNEEFDIEIPRCLSCMERGRILRSANGSCRISCRRDGGICCETNQHPTTEAAVDAWVRLTGPRVKGQAAQTQSSQAVSR